MFPTIVLAFCCAHTDSFFFCSVLFPCVILDESYYRRSEIRDAIIDCFALPVYLYSLSQPTVGYAIFFMDALFDQP